MTPDKTHSPTAGSHPTPTRRFLIGQRICVAWATLLGIEPGRIDPAASFFELGVDSLLLIQMSKIIREDFEVKLSFRRLLEEFTSIDELAAYLDKTIPPERFQPEVAPIVTMEPELASLVVGASIPSATTLNGAQSSMQALIAEQLRIMARQLEILRESPAAALDTSSTSSVSPPALPSNSENATADKVAAKITAPQITQAPAVFVPYSPVQPHPGGALSERQSKHLSSFIGRYNARSQKSKSHIARHRPHFADNRAIQSFRLQWKELVYPLVSQKSEGVHLWDLDGNQYVDLTMGFGVHMFGHSPRFITDALRRQVDQGLQLGPQSYLAGEVAEGISELTGMSRVAFCNSGTEAVMTAIRLARVATGRDKIVMFAGSYHGTYDGTLARIEKGPNGVLRTASAGPGIPAGMIADVCVLPYDDPQSLDFIRRQSHSLAAVLVEPVQSRRPDIQPREFLQELRRITAYSGTALIFDDIICGFRVHPGGTQGWFGVKADMATYGKVVAGGMPIGLVAGSPEYLGGIDGGLWNYGDDSYPQSDQVIYAGTFCKHPLTMAASLAVLEHIRREGPNLQLDLNYKADQFVTSANRIFEENRMAIRMVNFGSVMRFLVTGNPVYTDLFFFHLLEKGVFVWEGRTAFLSTAHTDADLQFVLRAIELTVAELRDGGFLEEYASPSPSPQKNEGIPSEVLVPATEQQKHMWALTQFSEESSLAYNEALVIKCDALLDVGALDVALQQVVTRHDSLRTVFTEDGQHQRILSCLPVPLRSLDLSTEPDAEARKTKALRDEAQKVFDLTLGPLLGVLFITTGSESSILAITAHHTILDGWSGGTLLRDLSAHYLAAVRHESLTSEKPMQFSGYMNWQDHQQDFSSLNKGREYWVQRFSDGVPILDMPTHGPRPDVYTHRGGHDRLLLHTDAYERMKEFSAREQQTPFITLLSVYSVLIAHVSGQNDFIVGVPSAGQVLSGGAGDLIGHCVNLVPLRFRVKRDASFREHVDACRREFLEASEHQLYPYGLLAKDLNLKRDPKRLTMVETVFNLDRSPDEVRLFGTRVEIDVTPTGHTAWDLNWNVNDTGNTLRLQCEYNRDLFTASTVGRWMEQFGLLLDVACSAPNALLAQTMEVATARLREQSGRNVESLKAVNLERLRRQIRKVVTVSKEGNSIVTSTKL